MIDAEQANRGSISGTEQRKAILRSEPQEHVLRQ